MRCSAVLLASFHAAGFSLGRPAAPARPPVVGWHPAVPTAREPVLQPALPAPARLRGSVPVPEPTGVSFRSAGAPFPAAREALRVPEQLKDAAAGRPADPRARAPAAVGMLALGFVFLARQRRPRVAAALAVAGVRRASPGSGAAAKPVTEEQIAELRRARDARAAEFVAVEVAMRAVQRSGLDPVRAGTDETAVDSTVPKNVLTLVKEKLVKEARALAAEAQGRGPKPTPFVLSNARLREREVLRVARGAEDPFLIRLFDALFCRVLDACEDRPLARFWVQETVARTPYFAFLANLHLYETFGWWRRSAEQRRMYFAMDWNKGQHLRILEDLGADVGWRDRFLAEHASMVFYAVCCGLWNLNPRGAFRLASRIEQHAGESYEEFCLANREYLADAPAPGPAVAYYAGADMFLFDEFQSAATDPRRPRMDTLLDVFLAFRDDEVEDLEFLSAPGRSSQTRVRERLACLAQDAQPNGSVDDTPGGVVRAEYDRRRAQLALAELQLREAERALDVAGAGGLGYLSRTSGTYLDGAYGVPGSFAELAVRNFGREAGAILRELKSDPAARALRWIFRQDAEEPEVEDRDAEELKKLQDLVLSNDAVWAREHARPQVDSPLIIKLPYLALCVMLDKLFDGRPISRFWFLETVARMPYYSYLNMLQAYETLGWWKTSAAQKRVHFAEEWNEYHHLLIMESLGGDLKWRDRFFAQHAAFAYYWVLVGLWNVSPSLAYNFSELIEAHAVDTYAEFAEANKERLKAIPAPVVAKAYYNGACLWMFDEFQTDGNSTVRRPKIETLYDTFCAIRDDEGEHVKTMNVCQDDSTVLASPNEVKAATAVASLAALTQAPGVRELLEKLSAEGADSRVIIAQLAEQLSVESASELVAPIATFLGETLPFL